MRLERLSALGPMLLAAVLLAASCVAAARPQIVVALQPLKTEDAPEQPAGDRIAGMPLSDLAEAIGSGKVSSLEAVEAYLSRIARLDDAGPKLNSVIAVNPDALAQAKVLDAERAAGRLRGALHGVPVLLKDTIETKDNMPTTAGSLALKDNITGRDSAIAAGLRGQGAIILGKTNLSEWSDFRHPTSVSGWSGIGGQTRNPYALDRTPCGSSSGSAAAVVADLAAGAVGVETDGSIVCPASMTGAVGFKPSVGLVPLQGVVVVSPSQDAAGPVARSVKDAAMILSAIAAAPGRDFVGGLKADALKGKRIGVLMKLSGNNESVLRVFEGAHAELRQAGAELVAVDLMPDTAGMAQAELDMLLMDLKAGLNAYLANTAPAVEVKSLRDLIAFNERYWDIEMPYFDQDVLQAADRARPTSDPAYAAARASAKAIAQAGIEALMAAGGVDLLIAPTQGPAFLVDDVLGDQFLGNGLGSPGTLAAIAGYPHLTVPMGSVNGLPVGLSFIGRAGADADVLAAGYAFEQARGELPGPKLAEQP